MDARIMDLVQILRRMLPRKSELRPQCGQFRVRVVQRMPVVGLLCLRRWEAALLVGREH